MQRWGLLKSSREVQPAEFWAVVNNDVVSWGCLRSTEASALKLLEEEKRWRAITTGLRVVKVKVVEVGLE